MAGFALLERAQVEAWTDEEVVARVLAGETALFEILMRRHNQRLYRVARAVLRDDAEAEDVMQDAYVRAYQHLAQFAGRARFSTWLTRIAFHEALARVQRRARYEYIDSANDSSGGIMSLLATTAPNPEQQTSQRELGTVLESAILALPGKYRAVLVMRDIEEMSTAEAAECLEISEENVKVRLHRARALLRREVFSRMGEGRSNAFPFMAPRCDRVVRRVLEQIAVLQCLPAGEA